MTAIENANKSALLYAKAITPQILKICKPLKYFNIKKFGYFKFFKNHTLLGLLNGFHEYHKKYQNYILPHRKVFIKNANENIKDGYSYFFWPTKIKNDPYLSLNYEFNFWHGLTIYYRTYEYVEAFSFTFDRNSDYKTNFFLNNIELFYDFCKHFKATAKDLIDCSDKNKLSTYKENLAPDLFVNNDLQMKKNKEKFNLHMQNNTLHTKLTTLSNQENNCIQLLAKGRTMKEIGRFLNISPRTVESYIENIKSKTGSNFKSQIIDLFWNSQRKPPKS